MKRVFVKFINILEKKNQEMVIAVEREKEVTEDGVITYNYNYKGRKLTIKDSGDANLEMMMVVTTAMDTKNVAEETETLALLQRNIRLLYPSK